MQLPDDGFHQRRGCKGRPDTVWARWILPTGALVASWFQGEAEDTKEDPSRKRQRNANSGQTPGDADVPFELKDSDSRVIYDGQFLSSASVIKMKSARPCLTQQLRTSLKDAPRFQISFAQRTFQPSSPMTMADYTKSLMGVEMVSKRARGFDTSASKGASHKNFAVAP